jgi:hypothetical protein
VLLDKASVHVTLFNSRRMAGLRVLKILPSMKHALARNRYPSKIASSVNGTCGARAPNLVEVASNCAIVKLFNFHKPGASLARGQYKS